MRSLVLGGNGFIGSHLVSHLVSRLLEAGDAVRTYDRSTNKFGVAPGRPVPAG